MTATTFEKQRAKDLRENFSPGYIYPQRPMLWLYRMTPEQRAALEKTTKPLNEADAHHEDYKESDYLALEMFWLALAREFGFIYNTVNFTGELTFTAYPMAVD